MALPVHNACLTAQHGREDGLHDCLEEATRGRRARTLATDALKRGLNCVAPIHFSGEIKDSDFRLGNEIVFQGCVKLHEAAPTSPSLADPAAPSKDPPQCPWLCRRRAGFVAVMVVMSVLLTTILVFLLQSQQDAIEGLRPKGLTLVRRQKWLARSPKRQEPRLPTPVNVVVIQHSSGAGCHSQARCVDRVQEIQDLHMDGMNFSDIGYNLLVGGDGVVYEGRGWDIQGSSVKGWNNRSLAVCFMGNYRVSPPTSQMRDALFKALAFLVDLGKVDADYKLAGACQLTNSSNSRTSPGLRFMQDLKGWSHWWDYYSFDAACTFLN